MAFLEQFGKRVSDLGQGVATKTKNFSDINRLNNTISDEEQQITNAYVAIGQSYYENHKNDPNAEEMEKISYITDALSRIQLYQAQIKQIRGITQCPHCGAEISATAAFCSACGQNTGFVQPKRTCPVCGAQVNEGIAFCTACGNRLPQTAPAAAQEQPAAAPQQPEQQVSAPQQPVSPERVCPICHAKLENGMQFCTSCGAHVGSV